MKKRSSQRNRPETLRSARHQFSENGSKGWVYVIVNRGMPGLVKIGCSSKDPQLRATEFSRSAGTAMPYPYEVAYQVWTRNYSQVERLIHRELHGSRIDESGASGKEWFTLNLEAAISAIRSLLPPGSTEFDIKPVTLDTMKDARSAPSLNECSEGHIDSAYGFERAMPDADSGESFEARRPEQGESSSKQSAGGDRQPRWRNGFRQWGKSASSGARSSDSDGSLFKRVHRLELVCPACSYRSGSITLTRYEQPREENCPKCKYSYRLVHEW